MLFKVTPKKVIYNAIQYTGIDDDENYEEIVKFLDPYVCKDKEGIFDFRDSYYDLCFYSGTVLGIGFNNDDIGEETRLFVEEQGWILKTEEGTLIVLTDEEFNHLYEKEN